VYGTRKSVLGLSEKGAASRGPEYAHYQPAVRRSRKLPSSLNPWVAGVESAVRPSPSHLPSTV